MSLKLPGIATVANLRMRSRLSLLVVAMMIPLMGLLWVAFADRQADINVTRDEQHGLRYVVVVNQLLRDIQIHRDLSQIVRNGDASAKDPLASARQDIERDLIDLEAAQRTNRGLNTAEHYNFIRETWSSIAAMDDSQSAATVWNAHTALVEDGIFPLIFKIGNNSGLALDPDVDSQNAIQALTDTLPGLTEELSQARGLGAGALAGGVGVQVSEQARRDVQERMTRSQLLSEMFVRNLQESVETNPAHEEAFKTLMLESSIHRNEFLRAVDQHILSTTTTRGQAMPFFITGKHSIDTTNDILVAAQDVLDREFDERISASQGEMYRQGSMAMVAIALAFLMVIAIAASITRPISHLVEVADRISLGELDAEIDVNSTNEVGQLAESLRRMQASLRSAIERLRMRRAA